MATTITITAIGPFSGDQRPAHSGVYLRTLPGAGAKAWSYYNARTKLWGCWTFNRCRAYQDRYLPSRHQRLPWFALPFCLPAATGVAHTEGLTFRVTPAKS